MTIPFHKLNGLEWNGPDLQKKFNDTYVKATLIHGGVALVKSSVVHIHNAWIGDTIASCEYLNDLGKSKAVNVDWGGLFIEDDRPDPCITNLGDLEAFMFSYNPDRQWKRGFCSYNTFLHWGSLGISPVGHSMGWREARAILVPVHLHLDEALTQFKNVKVGARALNNNWWLIREKGTEAIKLYRRKAFIGSFMGKRLFASKLAKQLFSHEINLEMPILKAKYAYKS